MSSGNSEELAVGFFQTRYREFDRMSSLLQQCQEDKVDAIDVFTYYRDIVRPGLDRNFADFLHPFGDMVPWLQEFLQSNGDFKDSHNVYKTESLKFVTDLVSCIECMYCYATQDIYRRLDSRQAGNLQRQHGIFVPLLPALEEDMKGPFGRFCCALPLTDTNPGWLNIVRRVREFARIIGYQEPSEEKGDRNVFSYIHFLRGKASESSRDQQIAALKAEINILTKERDESIKQLRIRNRIVASLTFRQVLERLPPPSSKTETNRWDEFWKKAVDNSQNKKESPLSKLRDKYARPERDPNKSPNVDYIRNAGGAALYSALSTNIHQFKGEYELQREQWNTLEWDVLNAITPLSENIHSDGSVDWAKERERFIPPGPSSSSAAAANPAIPIRAKASASSTTRNPPSAPGPSSGSMYGRAQ